MQVLFYCEGSLNEFKMNYNGNLGSFAILSQCHFPTQVKSPAIVGQLKILGRFDVVRLGHFYLFIWWENIDRL